MLVDPTPVANIAQQETTMLAQQCCVLSRAFARAFSLLAAVFFSSKGHLDECLFVVDSILRPQQRNT